MRYSLPPAYLALILPSVVTALSARSQCLPAKAQELAKASVCGTPASLEECLGRVQDVSEFNIRECLSTAGCSAEALESEARYLLSLCDGAPDEELRKRTPEPMLVEKAAAAANAGLFARASSSTSTTSDSSTSSTTSDSSTSSTTSDTTTTSTTSDTTTTATSTDSTTGTTTGVTSTTLVCSTVSTITVTSCEATNIYSCTPIATTTSVCAAGLYCDTDSSGNNLCMVRQDGLTTSGAIVSIFLAVVFSGMIASIIFLCCRDKSAQRKLRAKAEAAAIAKANMATTRPDRSEMKSISGTKPPPSASGSNPFAG
ncbi:hypothetical protein BX600DRAFT_517385 [Xylariales sp. PMI_506]|nr:hypothetical protein BX600DRAFT_517385 [Xylariales sp. PMI_506]